jgi:hypothetical protein
MTGGDWVGIRPMELPPATAAIVSRSPENRQSANGPVPVAPQYLNERPVSG